MNKNFNHLWKILGVYFGTFWVLLEASNFFINNYSIPDVLQDIVLSTGIFGLPIIIASLYFNNWRNKKFIGITGISIVSFIISLTQFEYTSTDPGEKEMPTFSVAILPFENNTTEELNDIFVDGISMNLSSQLSTLSQVSIIDYSTIKKASIGIDFSTIFKRIQADYIVYSAIQKEGEILTLDYNLFHSETGEEIHKGSKKFEIEAIFEIENSIASEIVQVLNISISKTEKMLINRLPTSSFDAYKLYLEGKKHYSTNESNSLDSALSYFKSAIALDSSFGLANSGLIDCYSRLYRLTDQDLFLDSARIIVEKFLEIDSMAAEVYNSIGTFEFYSKNYSKAQEYYEKGLKLKPSYSNLVGNYAIMSFVWGDLAQSIKLQRRTLKFIPDDDITYFMLGWTHRLLGNYDIAEGYLNKAITNNNTIPDFKRELGYILTIKNDSTGASQLMSEIYYMDTTSVKISQEAGLVALFSQEMDSAQKYYQHAVNLEGYNPNNPNATAELVLGYLDYISEDSDITRLNAFQDRQMDEINLGSEDDDPRFHLASIFAIKGNQEESVKWLNRAIDKNWNDLDKALHLPWFKSMQSYPEFQKIIQSLQLNQLQFNDQLKGLK